MIDVDLTPEAYAVVQEGVIRKSRKGGMYKVQMPRKLAEKLNALRDVGEDLSDVIAAPGSGGEMRGRGCQQASRSESAAGLEVRSTRSRTGAGGSAGTRA